MKKKPKKKLTLAQKLAFRTPIVRQVSVALPPPRDRMGVRANGC